MHMRRIVRGSNSGGDETFRTRQTCPWVTQPHVEWVSGLCTRRQEAGAWRYHPPHLVPRLKKEKSYTSTPHLGLHGFFEGELYIFIYCHTPFQDQKVGGASVTAISEIRAC